MRDLPAIDNLLCFEAAARLLSFRAAAKSVALTPAAVGQRIKQLEEQLGVRLFERSSRSVQLTEAGRALLPVARECIASGRRCALAVRGALGEARVEVVLGTRFELGMSWLVPSLPGLDEALGGLTIHLHFGSGPEILEALAARRIDCAVTSARLADVGLTALRLHEERYVFVGAPALLARTPLDAPEHAEAHTLLDIDPSLPLLRYFGAALDDPGLRFAGFRWLGLGAAIAELTRQGAGVAVLPRHMVERDLESGALVQLLPQLTLQTDYFRLVYRVGDTRDALFAELAEALAARPIR